jgi:hypothetical protein
MMGVSLILRSTTIHHIDLPHLDTPMLQILVDLVQVGVSQSSVSRSSIDTIMENINAFLGENRGTMPVFNRLVVSSDDVFRLVLGLLWYCIVKPVITLLKIQVSALVWSELVNHSYGIIETRVGRIARLDMVPNWTIQLSSHPRSWALQQRAIR